MTIEQAKELQPGDEVKWNDPDNGICSKILTIGSIVVDGVCKINEKNGGYLECFAHELA